MKAKLRTLLGPLWRFLTVIPGWPDAGRVGRTFYALPLAVPFAVLLLLLGVDFLWRRPHIRAVRAACAPVVALEEEVAGLESDGSDARAAELAEKVASLRKGLVTDTAGLDALLDGMHDRAVAAGWEITLNANEPAAMEPEAADDFVFQTVRGRLVPVAGEGGGDFRALLVLLEQLVPAEIRGGLTRVAIHADDQGALAVDIGIRLAVVPPR